MTGEYGGRGTAMFQKLPGHKNVVAWQKASDLSYLITKAVKNFGPGWWKLADQMRTAAWSVDGNIAEGYGRSSVGDYLRFCEIARGSLHELGSYVQDCERAEQIESEPLVAIIDCFQRTTYFLDRLIQGIQKRSAAGDWNRSFSVKEEPVTYDVSSSTPIRETWGTVDGPANFL